MPASAEEKIFVTFNAYIKMDGFFLLVCIWQSYFVS